MTTAGSFAAEPRDPRIPTWQQSHLEESNPAVRALYMLAVCVRNDRREAAEDMLRAEPDSPAEIEAMHRVLPPGIDPCLRRVTQLRLRGRTALRGAIAEAIYNGQLVRPLSDTPLPTRPGGAPVPTSHGRAFAACVVARSPMKAHQVVQFDPGMPGETRALQALTETFLACLPPGDSLRVPRLIIRARIAEALLNASRAFPETFRITRAM